MKLFIATLQTLIFLGFGNLIFGQNTAENYGNHLQMEIGKTFLATGDYKGMLFGGEYGKGIGKRLGIDLKFHIVHASGRGYAFFDDKKYTFVSEDVENPFQDFLLSDSLYFSGGIKHLETHLNRVTHISVDIAVDYELLQKEKHSLKPGLGISLTYKDASYFSGAYPGEFDGSPFFPIQDIVIIQPVYLRSYDIGGLFKLDYNYNINDRLYIGLNGTLRYYFTSEDIIYSISPSVGVRF